MVKYLDYVSREISKVAPIFVKDINMYKNMYIKYEKSFSFSPIYNGTIDLWNRHNFILPTGESFSISWDIDLIYNKYYNTSDTKYISLDEFDDFFENDLRNSKDEFDKINTEVNSIHSHTYNDILTMYFKPFHCNLIIDGRHRYTEFKKFKPKQLINISYLNSNEIIDCIIYTSDFVKYIILNNIDELNEYIFLRKGNLQNIISFEKYGL